ncbi:GNAT family N-acetyltransferase [Leucobacter luti]|uniref:Putative GNAT family acetyltransferase n=1 Tax=Leucobacter luti TaxID=340320 RepID=A0A4Q7TWG8_9MICO|nr:GNAT family N-acetyltransferase [Leucobacter luti]MBL3698362.1 N-acetyltransferase [Leucobacter luti]RZT64550.1 putative GNAT family acetyltransferase [Leucobacter luti]
MARYLTEDEAAAAGFEIVHEPKQDRFALYLDAADGRRLVGEAQYRLVGEPGPGASAAPATDTAAGTIDFTHTAVLPEFRGTGLSGILAHHVVTNPIVHGRRVLTTCWFIEKYLARHPELLGAGA